MAPEVAPYQQVVYGHQGEMESHEARSSFWTHESVIAIIDSAKGKQFRISHVRKEDGSSNEYVLLAEWLFNAKSQAWYARRSITFNVALSVQVIDALIQAAQEQPFG